MGSGSGRIHGVGELGGDRSGGSVVGRVIEAP